MSAVDLLNDITRMENAEVPSSEYVKAELFARYLGEEGTKIDKDVMSQFREAVKKLEGKIDAEFYGLKKLFSGAQA